MLIELTDLTSDHVQQQVETIKWFRDMERIFNQNASQFENYKSDFEEHLQKTTKKLVQDIESLIPNIAVINDMSDTNKLREYQRLLGDFMENLRCFEDYITWINKEEKLFKFPISKYPVLEDLTGYVGPFLELIT